MFLRHSSFEGGDPSQVLGIRIPFKKDLSLFIVATLKEQNFLMNALIEHDAIHWLKHHCVSYQRAPQYCAVYKRLTSLLQLLKLNIHETFIFQIRKVFRETFDQRRHFLRKSNNVSLKCPNAKMISQSVSFIGNDWWHVTKLSSALTSSSMVFLFQFLRNTNVIQYKIADYIFFLTVFRFSKLY